MGKTSPSRATSGFLGSKLVNVHVVAALQAQVDVSGLKSVNWVPKQGQSETTGYQFPGINDNVN